VIAVGSRSPDPAGAGSSTGLDPHHVTTPIRRNLTVHAERTYWKDEHVAVYFKRVDDIDEDPNAPLEAFERAGPGHGSLFILGYHADTPVGGTPVRVEKLEPENDVVGVIVSVIGPQDLTALLEMPGGALQLDLRPPEPSLGEKLRDPAVLAIVAAALVAGLLAGRLWARRRR
jgi:hypothetical protein